MVIHVASPVVAGAAVFDCPVSARQGGDDAGRMLMVAGMFTGRIYDHISAGPRTIVSPIMHIVAATIDDFGLIAVWQCVDFVAGSVGGNCCWMRIDIGIDATRQQGCCGESEASKKEWRC